MRGLAAANSLVRKGYSVTILEASSRLGGCLRDLAEAIMPAAVLEKELDVLLELHVTVEYNRTVLALAEAQAIIMEGFSAVFVSCASPLDALADGATLLTGQKNIVAGSRAGRFGDGNSSIYELFDGMSAAISIDRLCQEVSVD